MQRADGGRGRGAARNGGLARHGMGDMDAESQRSQVMVVKQIAGSLYTCRGPGEIFVKLNSNHTRMESSLSKSEGRKVIWTNR